MGFGKKWISVAAHHLPKAKEILKTVGGGVGVAAGMDIYTTVKDKLKAHGVPHVEHEGDHDLPRDHHRVH